MRCRAKEAMCRSGRALTYLVALDSAAMRICGGCSAWLRTEMAFMAAKNLTETHSANAAVRQFIHRIPSAICVTVAMMHGAMADNFADYRNGRGLRYLVPALSLDTTP